MEIAGDRPPRYAKIKFDAGQRGGQAPALREHQNQEGAPTVLHRDQEVSPTGKALIYETPSDKIGDKTE